jgi:hypothetical protein
MKKLVAATIVFTLALAVLAGCSGTDVVLKYAPGSFQKIVDKYPNLITDTTTADHYYNLTADGRTKLHISHDYDLTKNEDITIETPIQPFVEAGLDVTKLGTGYKVAGDTLYLTVDDGSGTGMKNNVKDALFESVTADRANLTYHQKLDHYGIKLTNGKFEWAKDYTANDKDIVFVLYAQPLKDAGVNVENVAGWAFMAVDNPDGSKTDILAKPADLDAK